MKFASGKEMYEFVSAGRDLYNKNEGLYLFAYNDANALCYYRLNESEAEEIARKADELGEYWGAFLGWGGDILDNTEYDHFRYSDNEDERALYLKPSLDFCEKYFKCKGWATTDKAFLRTQYLQQKQAEG